MKFICIILVVCFLFSIHYSKSNIKFNSVSQKVIFDQINKKLIKKNVFSNSDFKQKITNSRKGEMVWERLKEFGLFENTGVSEKSQFVGGSTSILYTESEPDELEVIPFSSQSGEPKLTWQSKNVQVAIGEEGNTAVALSFDDFDTSITINKYSLGEKITLDWQKRFEGYFPGENGIAVSNDGNKIALLCQKVDFSSNQTRLFVFNKNSGTPISTWVGSISPRTVVMTHTGKLAAFHTNSSVYVYDTESNKLVWSKDLHYSDQAIDISSNGDFLVVGFMYLETYKWNPSSKIYDLQWIHTNPNFWLSEVEVNDNGHIVAGFSSFNINQPLIQVFHLDSKLIWSYYYGISQSLQDLVWSLKLNDKGDFFVVGTWGSQEESNPQTRVFSVYNQNPIFTHYSSGSVFAVSIGEQKDGKLNVVSGGKRTHANIAGRGGFLDYFVVSDNSASKKK